MAAQRAYEKYEEKAYEKYEQRRSFITEQLGFGDKNGPYGTEPKAKTPAPAPQSAAPQQGQKTQDAADKSQLASPRSKADYDALPPGTKYMAPDGSTRTKPQALNQ
jgi:hypothetical protein